MCRVGAYANLRFSDQSASCPAVAYRLSIDDINTLDSLEGEPNHYLRAVTMFQPQHDAPQMMQTYIAHPDKLFSGEPPRGSYLKHILEGYNEYGFDTTYIEHLFENHKFA